MKGNVGWKVYWTVAILFSVVVAISSESFIAIPAILVVALLLGLILLLVTPMGRIPESELPAQASNPPADAGSRWLTPDEKNALFKDANRASLPVVLRDTGEGLYLTDPGSGRQMPFDNNRMPRAELWGVNARGHSFYPQSKRVQAGDSVALVREPQNPHDPNAVAIKHDGKLIGYYNRGMAKRLARRGIGGLEAYVLGITREDTPRVLAAPADVWDQIGRPS